VVSFTNGETTASVLQGFTLQHGQTSFEGGGIYISSASPTITGNVITGNTACNGGGGITAAVGSPVIQGNTITGNGQGAFSGGVGGGGIDAVNQSDAAIVQNLITGNSAAEARHSMC
jgi:Right handed beta helix region